LRIGFTNTTGGPSLSRLVAAFEARNPNCDVAIHEIPVADPYAALRVGEVDVLVNWLAIDEPDLTAGPAIDRQDRVLAVASNHLLAGRDTVSVEDLAGLQVAHFPPNFPPALHEALVPSQTPSGAIIPQSLAVLWPTASPRRGRWWLVG
jgi:DNA-binding transcriptional LysR family regulator